MNYIFPFANVSNLSDLFSDEIIPFNQFSTYEALKLDSHTESNYFNNDEIDQNILTNNASHCSYTDLNYFDNPALEPGDFSLFCLNVNSLSKSFDDVLSNLKVEEHFPNILGFCETKLCKDTQNLFSVPGYEGLFNSRNARSGGLALFIKSGIKSEILHEYSFSYDFIETLCVKLSLNGGELFLCLLYRRPGTNFDDFLAHYAMILEGIGHKNSLVVGDFNVDLLKYDSSNFTEVFVNTNFQNSFFPLINKPTRVTSHSATVIDHIWCNFIYNHNFENKIVLTDFSDHFAVFTRIIGYGNSNPTFCSFSYRDWKRVDDDAFLEAVRIKMEEFRIGNGDFDVDTALESIISGIEAVVDQICPLKTISKKKEQNPWMSNDLKALIKEKNRLFSKYCKKPISFGNQYRSCRNRLNNALKSAKKNYYKNLIDSVKNDSKKTWDILNKLLNRNRSNDRKIDKIEDGGSFTTDPVQIVNVLNNYFINAPLDLSNSLTPTQGTDFRSFLTGHYHSSMFIRYLTPERVVKIVSGLKNTASGGHYNIPVRVVRKIVHLISEHLSAIFNVCIDKGYFPKCLKIAQVSPIFKSGDITKPNNFRPISVLPIFSKIFEKHIYDELNSYLDRHNVLVEQQSGFREGVSTNVAIAKFLKKVYEGLNCGRFCVGVFLDLRKAFDMVNRDILLRKLEHYGVRGVPLDLIRSFLTDRQQYVKVGDNKSDIATTNLGTPQGSVLSPLLFLVFINDIVNCSNSLCFNLFADDTCVYMDDTKIDTLYDRLNFELPKVERWISANCLSLNVSKTVYLLFSGRKHVRNIPSLYLFNEPIQRNSVTKFLGLMIDDKLSWKDHVNYVYGKSSRMVGIIYRTRGFLTLEALKTIYYSLVYPHLLYGIIFWGSVNQNNFDKIFRVQKKIIRLITGSHYLLLYS